MRCNLDGELSFPNGLAKQPSPITCNSEFSISSKSSFFRLSNPRLGNIRTLLPTTNLSMPNMEEINLPEGLKEIGGRAFEGCEKLWIDKLPETLEFIGESLSLP